MNTKELAEKYLQKMKDVRNNADFDTEYAHRVADQILCDLLSELGFDEVVDEYVHIYKWYA